MSATTVPDSDLGAGFLGEPCFEQPHVLVRYSRFDVVLHVVYEPDGETVRVVIPTYE